MNWTGLTPGALSLADGGPIVTTMTSPAPAAAPGAHWPVAPDLDPPVCPPRARGRAAPAYGAGPSTEERAGLLAGLRLGRADAWEDLVREQLPRLLAVARRILRDEEGARDAVQEAFAAAFRNLDGFAGHAAVPTWLHRITVNAALMRLRSRRSRPEESLDELLPQFEPDGRHKARPQSGAAPQDEQLCREETRRLVRQAIDRLPEAYRTVVLLRDIGELDTAEAAELLGVSSGVVKVRLHRARQALRSLLDSSLGSGW